MSISRINPKPSLLVKELFMLNGQIHHTVQILFTDILSVCTIRKHITDTFPCMYNMKQQEHSESTDLPQGRSLPHIAQIPNSESQYGDSDQP